MAEVGIYESVLVAFLVTVTNTQQKPFKGRDLLWSMVSEHSVLHGREAPWLWECGQAPHMVARK